MTKKGKGKQSSGFSSKSIKATHRQEVQRIQDETLRWTRRETSEFVAWTVQQQKSRPRFAVSLLRRNLTNILDERRSEKAYLLREKRRRNGFLPQLSNHSYQSGFVGDIADYYDPEQVASGLVHPAGWILNHGESVNNSSQDAFEGPRSLQELALEVFARYIREYKDAMGNEELYGALSVLPPNSLTELSVLLSSQSSPRDSDRNRKPTTDASSEHPTQRRKNTAKDRAMKSTIRETPNAYMDDSLALLLGQHPHVERLSLRNHKIRRVPSTSSRNSLTSHGLNQLIPKTPSVSQWNRRCSVNDRNQGQDCENGDDDSVLSCWEDLDDFLESGDSLFGAHSEFLVEERDTIIPNQGCNLKLRRLELLDLDGDVGDHDVLNDGSTTSMLQVLLRWFEKCSGITHLSLAGSFQMHHEVGMKVLAALPRLLPALEVLDVTRCPWAADAVLYRMLEGYSMRERQGPVVLPIVYHHKGRFLLDTSLSFREGSPGSIKFHHDAMDPWIGDDEHSD